MFGKARIVLVVQLAELWLTDSKAWVQIPCEQCDKSAQRQIKKFYLFYSIKSPNRIGKFFHNQQKFSFPTSTLIRFLQI